MADESEADPSKLRAICGCGEEMWSKRDGEWTLRARIVRLRKGRFEGMCWKCKSTVPLPFLTLHAAPSVGSRIGVRRIIRVDG